MQNFKNIIMPMQGQSKSNLHWLYNTLNSKFDELDDVDRVFSYYTLKFWFGGTNYRSSEKLLLYIEIPNVFFDRNNMKHVLPVETYILGKMSSIVSELSTKYVNIDKNVREKAQFQSQRVNENVLRRSGLLYKNDNNTFVFRINFNVPLLNALSVNAKSTIRAVRDILSHILIFIKEFNRDEMNLYIKTYAYQQEIRKYILENGLCAFIANGSILPRENGTALPMKNALPFKSPKENEVIVRLSDGTQIAGMGIKKGVTVITGGGYSGKSTLLNAIEMGIYNHIPGDGREYVLTDNSALKIYAEDGRPISHLDISPFFKCLPRGAEIEDFSTSHASGSVSQAANIVEAVCGKCRLLLIDEDKSATNFMIRDKNMRRIVKNEPIIPFTDRVCELYSDHGVSTILVIGGSSEYLSYSDTVILMEDYQPRIITNEVRSLDLPDTKHSEITANWTVSRFLVPKETSKDYLYFQSVKTENDNKIILDDYTADVTLLTALISENQLNTLACVMERLLTDKKSDEAELLDKVKRYIEITMGENDTSSLIPEVARRFYEEIREIDAFCCVNRIRGLLFRTSGGDANE